MGQKRINNKIGNLPKKEPLRYDFQGVADCHDYLSHVFSKSQTIQDACRQWLSQYNALVAVAVVKVQPRIGDQSIGITCNVLTQQLRLRNCT